VKLLAWAHVSFVQRGQRIDGRSRRLIKESSLLSDLSALLRPPYVFLTLGVVSVSAAVIFTSTGRVWVRFNGWVYRTKEPRSFWGEVAAYLVVGLCFIAYFLFQFLRFARG
jgi:hypothetical protein